MLPPDFCWRSVASRADELPDAIYCGMTEVLRLSQCVDNKVRWVEVERHLDDQHRGRRLCTSYEQGVIGTELRGKASAAASPGDRPARSGPHGPAEEPDLVGSQPALPQYRRVRPPAVTVAPWIKRASARHAGRAKAASLWQQADDPDMNHSGDWRVRATRRRGADRLRVEAARFDGIANRLQRLDDDQAA